ncbi:MAG: large subunit ribosomal protein L13 [Candidatus Deianiraeaceae bacterium]|jgi:large subunit ribosomal protein L13
MKVNSVNTTKFVYTKHNERNWYIIDASCAPLGKIAVQVANILRGKNKPSFTPNSDNGDYIIIINAKSVVFTGKKLDKKEYWYHTGFPGGEKTVTPNKAIAKGVMSKYIMKTVRGMLPRGPLGNAEFSKLFVYEDLDHKHEAQKPQVLEIK